MTLQLEAHHLSNFTADGRQLDRLDGHRAARQPEGDRADGKLALFDLGAKRFGRILAGHDECFDTSSVNDARDETIAERKDGEVSPSKHHKVRLR